jgi:hypothetical protein
MMTMLLFNLHLVTDRCPFEMYHLVKIFSAPGIISGIKVIVVFVTQNVSLFASDPIINF